LTRGLCLRLDGSDLHGAMGVSLRNTKFASGGIDAALRVLRAGPSPVTHDSRFSLKRLSAFLYLLLRALDPFRHMLVVFELIPRRNVSLLLTVRGYLSDFLKRRSKW
jgi:hypothetical protein